MRIRSRTARRFDAFDRRFDAAVATVLLSAGFTETRPYVFARPDSNGMDFVYFDVEVKSFIVHIGYKPQYMEEIEQLFEHLFLPKEPHIGGGDGEPTEVITLSLTFDHRVVNGAGAANFVYDVKERIENFAVPKLSPKN
jgi:hypothetical protein